MHGIRLSLVSSAGTALAIVLALGVPTAQAQFVCVGNADGSTVPPATASGAGATAAGGANNVACGTNANASGTTGSNAAFGNGANASGDLGNNVATGNQANASGSPVTSTLGTVASPMPAATARSTSRPARERTPAVTCCPLRSVGQR